MMEIGIFAKTFVRPTLEEVLDAVKEHGLHQIQFNLVSAGLPSLPDSIHPSLADHIRQEMSVRGLTMAAISGTFNMIHPDLDKRQAGFRRLYTLAAACERLGTSIITLCTGSRDPYNMWRYHPDNESPQAWEDLLSSIAKALNIAAKYKVTLAIEPEPANVVNSAARARRLLDEFASPQLKVVIDGANLFPAGELARMTAVLDEAFDVLGQDIVLAHAKDLTEDGAAGQAAAGTGRLDYDHYLALLQKVGYTGPLILHGLSEAQVPASVAFLREKLAALNGNGVGSAA
jgi:sugar phosphate isomerase/epimerase